MLSKFFRHTCHRDTLGLLLTYIPGISQQQCKVQMILPPFAITIILWPMLVSILSNWKKNIGLAARMNWMLQMNQISFAENSLDCMTTKCQNCVIIALCTNSYYWTLRWPYVVLGMTIFVCYCKDESCNPNRYKSLFSLAYPFPLMCKTLLVCVKLCKCLRTGVEKPSMVWRCSWPFCK